jgi:release factor glutamine methyltransferase
MKLRDVLEKTTTFFKDKNFDSPRLDAELLLANALDLRRLDLYLKYDQPLAEAEVEKCRGLVRRRISGEPVAYILGQKEFYGLNFFVNSSVLIPRPETEGLVEEVLAHVKKQNLQESPLKIVDLGCGSGCIGLALLKLLPEAQATLVDISVEALQTAKTNAAHLELSERANFVEASAAKIELENEKFDIIVANPPYISKTDDRVQVEVKQFEPHQALFSEEEGLADLYSWSKNASRALKPNGVMAFEFGIDQSENVKKHFENLNIFSQIKIVKDLSGIDRLVVAVRKDL